MNVFNSFHNFYKQQLMDMELLGNKRSTLSSTFEMFGESSYANQNNTHSHTKSHIHTSADKYDSHDEVIIPEVDEQRNVLKYLLESHAAQATMGGGGGPASQLLSQLGLNLPKPPTLSSRNK